MPIDLGTTSDYNRLELDCYNRLIDFLDYYRDRPDKPEEYYLYLRYLKCVRDNSDDCFGLGIFGDDDDDDVVEWDQQGRIRIKFCKLVIPQLPPDPVSPPQEDPVFPKETLDPGIDGGTWTNNPPKKVDIVANPKDEHEPIWWYHSDHLGSSSYITDIFGTPCQYIEYLPFGEIMAQQSTNNIFENVYKFNAKELDESTGYYYYGARYYDPGTSVFLSVDPLAEQFPGWTPYRYGFNNPIRYTDPTGMLEDDYTVNKSGKIELVRKTDDKTDKLIALDDNGKESNQSIEVDKGVLNKIKSGNNDGKKYGYMEVRGNSKATNIFEFLARNTDVEWSQAGYGVDRNYISSSYDRKTDYSSPDLLSKLVTGGFSIRMHTHSHPSPFVEGPSGFSPGEEGDRQFASQVSKYVPKMIFKVFSVVNNKYIRYDGKKIYED